MSVNQKSAEKVPNRKIVRKNLLSMHEDLSNWSHMLQGTFLSDPGVQPNAIASVHQRINTYSNKYRPLSMSFQQWQNSKVTEKTSEVGKSVTTQEFDIHNALQYLAFQLQIVSNLELQLKNDAESGVHVHGDQQLKSEIEQLMFSSPSCISSNESIDDPFSAKLDYILEDKEESFISSVEGSETLSNISEVAVGDVSVESESHNEGHTVKLVGEAEHCESLSFLTKLKSTSVDDGLNFEDAVSDKSSPVDEDNVFTINVDEVAAASTSLERKLSFDSHEEHQTTLKEENEVFIDSLPGNELVRPTTESIETRTVFVEKETVTTNIAQMATIIHLATDSRVKEEPEKAEAAVLPLLEDDEINKPKNSMVNTENYVEAAETVSLLHVVSEKGVLKDTEPTSHVAAIDDSTSVTSDSLHAIEIVENEFSNIGDTGHFDDNDSAADAMTEFEGTLEKSTEVLSETAEFSDLKKDEIQNFSINEEISLEKVSTKAKHSIHDNESINEKVGQSEVNEVIDMESSSCHEEVSDLLNEADVQEKLDVVEVFEAKNHQRIRICGETEDQTPHTQTDKKEESHQLEIAKEEVMIDNDSYSQVHDVNTSEQSASDIDTETCSSGALSDDDNQISSPETMLPHPETPVSQDRHTALDNTPEVEQDSSVSSSSEIIGISNSSNEFVSTEVIQTSVITKHGINVESSSATFVDIPKNVHEVVVLEKLSLSSSKDFNQLHPTKDIFVEETGRSHVADGEQTNAPIKLLYVEEPKPDTFTDGVVFNSEVSSLEKALHVGQIQLQSNQLAREIENGDAEKEVQGVDGRMQEDAEVLPVLQESLDFENKKHISLKNDDSPRSHTEEVHIESEVSNIIKVENEISDSGEESMQSSKIYNDNMKSSKDDHENQAMPPTLVVEEKHSLPTSSEIDLPNIAKIQATEGVDQTNAPTSSVFSTSAAVANTSLTAVAIDKTSVETKEIIPMVGGNTESPAQDHRAEELTEERSVPFGMSSANLSKRSKVLFEQRKLLFERNSDTSNEQVVRPHRFTGGKISPKIKKLQSLGSTSSTNDEIVTTTHELNTSETSIKTNRMTTTKQFSIENTSASLISAQPFKFGFNKTSDVTPVKKVTFSPPAPMNPESIPTETHDKTSSVSVEPIKSPKPKVSPKPVVSAKPIKAFKPKFTSSESHFSKARSSSAVVTKRWNSNMQSNSPTEAPVVPNLPHTGDKPDTVLPVAANVKSPNRPLIPPIPDENTMKEIFSEKDFAAPLPFSASSNKPKFKPMRFGLTLKTRRPSETNKPSEDKIKVDDGTPQQNDSFASGSDSVSDFQPSKKSTVEVANSIDSLPNTNSIEADAKECNKNVSETITNSESESCIETPPLTNEDRIATIEIYASAPLCSTPLESEVDGFPNKEILEDQSSCLNALNDVIDSSPNTVNSSDDDDYERAYTDDDIDIQSGDDVLDLPKTLTASMTISNNDNTDDNIVMHRNDNDDVSATEEKPTVAIPLENDGFENDKMHVGEGTFKPTSEDFVNPPLPPPPSDAVYTSKAHFKVTSPTPRPVQKASTQEPSWSSSNDDLPLPPPPSDLSMSPPPTVSTSPFLQSDKPKGFRSVARPVLKPSKENGNTGPDRIYNGHGYNKLLQSNGPKENSVISASNNNHLRSPYVPNQNSSTQYSNLLGRHVTLLRDTRKILIKPVNSSHSKETIQNTYSIQGNPLPVSPSADTQVTPQGHLPDGAVYQTTSKEGDVVHTDTYYPATDQSDPKTVVLERTKTTTIVQAPHHQGIGPVSDSGVPYALRSTVDDSKHWYKNMFKQMHKVGHEDVPTHQTSVGRPQSAASGDDRHTSVGLSKPTKVGRITDYQPAAPYVVENKPVKLNLNQRTNIHNIRSSSSNANRNNNINSGEIRRSASLEDFSNIQWNDFFDDIYKPKPDSATSSASHTNISYKSPPTSATVKSHSAAYSSNAKDSMPETKRTTHAVNKASPKPQKDEDVRLPARAKFDFVPQTAKEYAMKKGQTVIVTKQVDNNWYMVESVDGVRGGIVPIAYVEVISGTSPEKPRRNGQARGKFDFIGTTKNELSFKKGDDIVLLKKVDENWYKGKLGGKTGILPVAYVEVIMEPEIETPKENPILKQLSPTPKSNTSHSHQSSVLSQASSDEPDEKERKERGAFLAQTVVGTKVSLHSREGHVHREDLLGVAPEPENVQEVQKTSRGYKSPNIQAEEVLNFSELDQAVEALSSGNQKTLHSPASQSTTSPPSSHLSPPSSIVTPSIPSYPSSNISTQPSSPHLSTPPINDYGQVIGCYVTLYAYEASNEDELDLQPGDLVMVVETCDDGWYVGTCQRTGAFGTFPGNYVSLTNTT